MDSRRLIAPVLAFVLLPATALAGDTGGTAASDTPPGYASASAGSVSFKTRTGGIVGKRKIFTGTVNPGELVTLEYWDAGQAAWAEIAQATAGEDGKFKARWKVNHSGTARIRARVESEEASAASAAPELDVKLYKPGGATWYTLYGHKTACGKRLTRTTIGVAHKTLPCGTEVEFYYKGRTITAPVIDRGPYSKGNSWDLTKAAADQIGLTATGQDTVGALYSR
jgi:hypothetical protein